MKYFTVLFLTIFCLDVFGASDEYLKRLQERASSPLKSQQSWEVLTPDEQSMLAGGAPSPGVGVSKIIAHIQLVFREFRQLESLSRHLDELDGNMTFFDGKQPPAAYEEAAQAYEGIIKRGNKKLLADPSDAAQVLKSVAELEEMEKNVREASKFLGHMRLYKDHAVLLSSDRLTDALTVIRECSLEIYRKLEQLRNLHSWVNLHQIFRNYAPAEYGAFFHFRV